MWDQWEKASTQFTCWKSLPNLPPATPLSWTHLYQCWWERILTNLHIVLPIFLTVGKLSEDDMGIYLTMKKTEHPFIYLNTFSIPSFFLFSGSVSVSCLFMSFAIFILANKSLGFFVSLKKLVLCIIHYVKCYNACPLSVT